MNFRETRMLAFANQVSVSAAFIVYVSVAIWLKICCRNLSILGRTAMAVALEEGDWVDGEVASVPHTASGHPVVWQVHIGTTNGAMTWADFKPHEALRMDAALGAGEKKVTLKCNDNSWTIDLSLMVQINDGTTTSRAIRRTVIVKQVLTG